MQWKSFWEKWKSWEHWPFGLRYAVISPFWIWYCIRSRSPWFFTPSNPTITFGGFEGEGKKEMYELLPPEFYPKTTFISPSLSFDEVIRNVRAKGFTYPFIVKPDVGMKGLLFRKIDSEEELRTYHRMNVVEYIVQDLVTYPLEVSVFYYRYPDNEKGVITGFIQKDLMDVFGDGNHTLWELINEHPKARHRLEEMRIKHAAQLQTVIPKGERFILTYAANLNRGANFTDLKDHIDDELLALFDRLSHKAQFFYGRYDIKCASIDDLKKGKNFSILEYNGSGAEPNHVYHTGYSLLGAYKVILHHWKVLYEISAINKKKGINYWPVKKGLAFLKEAKRHFAILEKADTEIPV